MALVRHFEFGHTRWKFAESENKDVGIMTSSGHYLIRFSTKTQSNIECPDEMGNIESGKGLWYS